MKNSDYNLILIEPNLLGVKATRKLIDKYKNDYKIEKNSLHIIENKVNINSINKDIIKCCFSDAKYLGKINYNNIYDKLINNNFNKLNIILNNKIKKEFKKINKTLENKK